MEQSNIAPKTYSHLIYVLY